MKEKKKTKEELCNLVAELKQSGKTIVTLSGTFDLLHAGHIYFLREAKKQGDILVVLLNSDSSVKLYKGKKRPVIGEDDRVEIISALEDVDYVTLFEDDTPIELIDLIKPDIFCNRSDLGENYVETDIVKKNGGKTHSIVLKEGISTTKIIEMIKSL